MTEIAVLSSLFFGAFFAATILPGASEIILVAILVEAEIDPVVAVLVASLGNTLGSMTNWVLGRYFASYADRKWFPVSKTGLAKAEAVFKRYGVWTLLLAWWPIGGDALTLAAGFLKVPFMLFAGLVGLGKLFRYIAVALGTMGFLS